MEVSAVRLRNSYQIYFVDTNNIFIRQNTLCLVETEHGIDIGHVVKCPAYQNNPSIEVKGKLLRKTVEDDMLHIPEIEAIEKKAFGICRDKANKKKLEMKLISVKCLYDKTKIIFYFVAENRIDFRELVRELAAVFKTRIEMRQIGVRDEARLVGGYGPCGKQLCCVNQREEFEPVSIKMAKEQNLNLNSLKISGMCGRLLCCLSYEYDTYRELNRKLPNPGSVLMAGDVKTVVSSVDTLREAVRFRLGDRMVEVLSSDLEQSNGRCSVRQATLDRITSPDEEGIDENDIN